jgi:VWFA-related protein
MLDISGSMGAVLRDVARAAEALVAHFIRGDRVNIGTFATAITYSSRFTANKRIIQEGIRDAMMGGEMICKLPSATGSSARPGGTWMWDAVECGVRVVSSDGEAFRRILLLVTDGMINGGYATESSALHRATDAGVLVYATGLRGVMGLDSPLLTGFTRATGGWYVTLKKGEDFTPIFKRIGEELHNQYVMSFLSTDAAQPVQVRVKDPELKVRTQRGRNITPKVP